MRVKTGDKEFRKDGRTEDKELNEKGKCERADRGQALGLSPMNSSSTSTAVHE